MNYTRILQDLRAVHDANGRLDAVRGHLANLERARAYNPRNRDTWDVFGLRNSDLDNIIRACERASRTFARLSSVRTSVRACSPQLRPLLADWFAKHAAHGADARQTRDAQVGFYVTLTNVRGDLVGMTREADALHETLKKYRKFYTRQGQIFVELEGIARNYVRFFPDSPNAGTAFHLMQQFDEIGNLSHRIMGSITAGRGNIRRFRRAIATVQSELDGWNSWANNRNRVQRDAERNRAPF